MPEKLIGKVENFFQKPSVAAVRVEGEGLKVGAKIKFHGATTDFVQIVDSMQIEHQNVSEAKIGELVGIKTTARVRPGDKVLLVEE